MSGYLHFPVQKHITLNAKTCSATQFAEEYLTHTDSYSNNVIWMLDKQYSIYYLLSSTQKSQVPGSSKRIYALKIIPVYLFFNLDR